MKIRKGGRQDGKSSGKFRIFSRRTGVPIPADRCQKDKVSCAYVLPNYLPSSTYSASLYLSFHNEIF